MNQHNLPLVSVVTPVFNAKPFIMENIQSILDQNYPNLEHIIFDGGSNDGTIEILESYPQIEWYSEKDKGQSDALNKGFKKAKGEIIGWLNADDSYTEGSLKKAVEFLQSNPDVDLVFTDLNIINQQGNKIGYSKGSEFDLEEILINNMVKQPSLFMRKSVLDKLIGLDVNVHYVMDYEFWIRAGLAGFKFKYLDNEVFANFRYMKGTKSYEAAPAFWQEKVIIAQKALQDKYYDYLAQDVKFAIINQLKRANQFSNISKYADKGNRSALVKEVALLIKREKVSNINRGIWKILLFGLLGLKQNKLSKFK